MKKHLFAAILSLSVLLLVGGGVAHTLTASTPYTITVYKMNNNGTLTSVTSTTATTDSSGKLSFSLSNMPTNSECNFIVFQITDGSGVVQRKGFAPAPPTGSTNLVGVNSLSTAQTNAIIAAAETLGSDDPIAAAFLLILLRSDAATTTDAAILAALGKDAITGTGGFEDFLLTNGVTPGQFALLKSYLVYNPTSGKKTIADLTASFKAAVDAVDSSTSKQEMQKAGGFMADVFMDAASGGGHRLRTDSRGPRCCRCGCTERNQPGAHGEPIGHGEDGHGAGDDLLPEADRGGPGEGGLHQGLECAGRDGHAG